jgi:BTB/POZ domain
MMVPTSSEIPQDSLHQQHIQSLEERIRKLELQSERHRNVIDRAEFKKEEPSGKDVIHLNVSGKKIAVLRSTLTILEGSMLAARFSGSWDDSLEKDKEGNFFINQPSDLFVLMIDFLQCTANASMTGEAIPFPSPTDLNGDRIRFQKFADLVEFYGMAPVVLPPTIEAVHTCRQPCRTSSPVTFVCQVCCYKPRICGHQVHSPKNVAYKLKPRPRHPHRIQSFEVEIGNVTSFRVGWCNHQTFRGADIGDTIDSVGFDAIANVVVSSGSPLRTNAPLPEKKDVRVIRCEREGSDLVWSVNGETHVRHCGGGGCDYDPAFSGAGTWWVSKIEF